MKNKIRSVAWLVVVSFALAASTARAEHEKSKQFTASEIIGKKVMNAQQEDLGKVHDLIVNFESGNVPYAVISSGFGARHQVAVPLESLQCAPDGKSFALNATKEEFKAASKSPQGRWAIARDAEWTKSIDGYYGQPTLTWRERFMRQPVGEGDTRVFTRDPAAKGAERLLQPADRALCEKICEAIDNVQVDVDNGVAHLYGTVETDAARKDIENKVRAVSGVQRVESHLKVKTR